MKFIVLINLFTLLCIGLSASIHPHYTATAGSDNSQSDRYSSVSSSDLFCNIIHNESSVSVAGSAAPSGIKDFFNDFSASIKISRQLTANLLTQYSFYAQCIITRLQNTDIIFPFHYFW